MGKREKLNWTDWTELAIVVVGLTSALLYKLGVMAGSMRFVLWLCALAIAIESIIPRAARWMSMKRSSEQGNYRAVARDETEKE